MRLPSKHDHVGSMIYSDDFCCCRACEQAWNLTEKGWVPIVGGRELQPTYGKKKWR